MFAVALHPKNFHLIWPVAHISLSLSSNGRRRRRGGNINQIDKFLPHCLCICVCVCVSVFISLKNSMKNRKSTTTKKDCMVWLVSCCCCRCYRTHECCWAFHISFHRIPIIKIAKKTVDFPSVHFSCIQQYFWKSIFRAVVVVFTLTPTFRYLSMFGFFLQLIVFWSILFVLSQLFSAAFAQPHTHTRTPGAVFGNKWIGCCCCCFFFSFYSFSIFVKYKTNGLREKNNR